MMPRWCARRVTTISVDAFTASVPESGVAVQLASCVVSASCAGTENFAGTRERLVTVTTRRSSCSRNTSPNAKVRGDKVRSATRLSARIGTRAIASPTPGTSSSTCSTYRFSTLGTNSTSIVCEPKGRIVPAEGSSENSGFATSTPGTRNANRMGISHAFLMANDSVRRNPSAAIPKSTPRRSSTSRNSNFGPTTRPRKSRNALRSPPSTANSNVSSNAPSVSLHNVTVIVRDWPTPMAPAFGSNENTRPESASDSVSRLANAHSISPRFTSSTSYWCTAPTNTSPTSSAS